MTGDKTSVVGGVVGSIVAVIVLCAILSIALVLYCKARQESPDPGTNKQELELREKQPDVLSKPTPKNIYN